MSNRHDPDNYYALLGVPPTASPDEIRAAFRARAKALHPDKNRQVDTKADFQRLREAYAVVGRPDQRRQYDLRARPEPVDSPRHAPEPMRTPAPTRPPPSRPRRKHRFAALAIPVLALVLYFYVFESAPKKEPPKLPVRTTEVEMEAAISQHARTLLGPPPEPAVAEIIGRDGRKFMISGADHKRLAPVYERLISESRLLQARKESLDARKTELENEGRAVSASNITTVVNLRIKADALNRDGAAFRRHAELHVAEVEAYFKQVEGARLGEPKP